MNGSSRGIPVARYFTSYNCLPFFDLVETLCHRVVLVVTTDHVTIGALGFTNLQDKKMIAFWNIRLLFAIPLTLILAFLFHGQLWGSAITPITKHAEYSTAIDDDGGTVYGKLSSSPRILQTTMLLGDQSNNITERCIKTHLEHGDRWGYKTIVLRRDFMSFEHENGANSGYPKLLWDKALHMLSLLLDELKKPDDVRAEWLM